MPSRQARGLPRALCSVQGDSLISGYITKIVQKEKAVTRGSAWTIVEAAGRVYLPSNKDMSWDLAARCNEQNAGRVIENTKSHDRHYIKPKRTGKKGVKGKTH